MMPPRFPSPSPVGSGDRVGTGGDRVSGRPVFTVEQATSLDSPREFRLSPDGRLVAWTAEAAGARQLFVMPVRGAVPRQVTASEKPVSDPEWSPDGRRFAVVRDNALW